MHKFVAPIRIVVLLALVASFVLSLDADSASVNATETDSTWFDEMLEERDWTPFGGANESGPEAGPIMAWTNKFVPRDYGANNTTHYVSSTSCGGGVYVYWWGVSSASLSSLGVWSSNVLNQLHINSWGGLHGHYDCHYGNRCDVRLCAKSGFGYHPGNTKLKY